mmetsp:Transcript_10181/g.25150  ORF Transcript_10181/g.25150 Transcript_10181/m.25150 type:complete len:320 (-) Transcript_10181:2434-3393(-)
MFLVCFSSVVLSFCFTSSMAFASFSLSSLEACSVEATCSCSFATSSLSFVTSAESDTPYLSCSAAARSCQRLSCSLVWSLSSTTACFSASSFPICCRRGPSWPLSDTSSTSSREARSEAAFESCRRAVLLSLYTDISRTCARSASYSSLPAPLLACACMAASSCALRSAMARPSCCVICRSLLASCCASSSLASARSFLFFRIPICCVSPTTSPPPAPSPAAGASEEPAAGSLRAERSRCFCSSATCSSSSLLRSSASSLACTRSFFSSSKAPTRLSLSSVSVAVDCSRAVTRAVAADRDSLASDSAWSFSACRATSRS